MNRKNTEIYQGDTSYMGPIIPKHEGIIANIAGVGIAAAMLGAEIVGAATDKAAVFGKVIIARYSNKSSEL